MSKYAPILFRPDGSPIRVGNTQIRLTTNFIGGKPSWVSTTGTEALQDLPGAPYCRATTAASIGATASILGPEITLSSFRRVVFRATSLKFSAGTSGFAAYFGVSSSGNGFGVRQVGAATCEALRGEDGATAAAIHHVFRGTSNDGAQFRNYEIGFVNNNTGNERYMWFAEDGVIQYSYLGPGGGLSTARPKIEVTVEGSAAAKEVQVCGLELELEYA